jgi:hypothetical protein
MCKSTLTDLQQFTDFDPPRPSQVDHTLPALSASSRFLASSPRQPDVATMAQTPRKLKPTVRKSTGTVAKKIGSQPLGGAKGRKSVGGGGKGKGGKSRRE